jgi:DNA-binding transcriptional ArsR family regulator
MSDARPITLTLDRRIFEHPRAYHLRRMRAGIWLYLDLLARLPAGASSIEVEPAAIAGAMGLPEGTIRSWLGHLRKAGYLEARRLNGGVTVRFSTVHASTPRVHISTPEAAQPVRLPRFFTVPKLVRALGDDADRDALEAALAQHSDESMKRALAGALAVPGSEIRKSRTALFLYLLKRP